LILNDCLGNNEEGYRGQEIYITTAGRVGEWYMARTVTACQSSSKYVFSHYR